MAAKIAKLNLTNLRRVAAVKQRRTQQKLNTHDTQLHTFFKQLHQNAKKVKIFESMMNMFFIFLFHFVLKI